MKFRVTVPASTRERFAGDASRHSTTFLPERVYTVETPEVRELIHPKFAAMTGVSLYIEDVHPFLECLTLVEYNALLASLKVEPLED